MPFDVRNRSPHRILERGGRGVRTGHHIENGEIVSGAQVFMEGETGADSTTATVYLDTTKAQGIKAGAGLAMPVDQAVAYAQKFPIGRAYNERDPFRFGIITNVYVLDSNGQQVPFTPTHVSAPHQAASHHGHYPKFLHHGGKR